MTVPAGKLLRMAEQIAVNVTASKDPAIIADKLADHIGRFWDPRMRHALIEHMDNDLPQVSPPVRLAVEILRTRAGLA